MRSLPSLSLALLVVLPGGIRDAAAAETATAALVVNAQFSSRTSLKVSTELLQFDVVSAGEPARAEVSFSAAARTQPNAEVVLSLEVVHGVGAPDAAPVVTFAGDGDGLSGGTLPASGPTVAGRWIGSGLHNGRLQFSLTAAAAGAHIVPLRFALSAP